MPICYGYARVCSSRGRVEKLTLEAQKEALPKIAAEKFPSHAFHGVYWDAQSASYLPFANRKAFGSIQRALKPGDAIVVLEGNLAFRNRSDHVACDWVFKSVGATLYIAKHSLTLGASATVDAWKTITAAYRTDLVTARVYDSFDYLGGQGIWFAGRTPLGWRKRLDRRLVPDVAYRAEIVRLFKIREVNHMRNTDLWIYCRKAGVRNHRGEPWDTRRLLEAFGAMRKGWKIRGWALGPEGHAVPEWHSSLANSDERESRASA